MAQTSASNSSCPLHASVSQNVNVSQPSWAVGVGVGNSGELQRLEFILKL